MLTLEERMQKDWERQRAKPKKCFCPACEHERKILKKASNGL
jgi:hypothetical protein